MTKQELIEAAQALEADAKGLFLTHRSTIIMIVVVAWGIGFIAGKIF